ncbi:MATE family efflux transporter [Azomonas macrocytogenes]|uniref:MATE family efflux transporter n=1 Tax=Azomonas macrocytogenes TaxID=69962 RepID=UPI0016059E2B|nr:MATE family efflux transporter [Azomonas macrocytogenes]
MSRLTKAWSHRPTHTKAWTLAAPMVLSNLSVPLVALTDITVVGHLPQAHQLGAVAVGAMFYEVMLGLFVFLRMGTTGFAAQAAGRSDGNELRRILFQSLVLGFGLALLVAVIAVPVGNTLLDSMSASPELKSLAQTYFQTRLFGLPAALTSCALIGWFLGIQNVRVPLGMLLTTNIINMMLALWFVLSLDWEAPGAARASVIAEWAGALLGLGLAWLVLPRYPGQLELSRLGHWRAWQPLLAVNRDILIRSLLLQGVFLLIAWRGAQLGDATVAANALLLNGLLFTAFALDGLAHALEALSGHAIGAGDRSGLERVLVICSGWAFIISLGFALFFWIGGNRFIQFQTDIEEVRSAAQAYLPYLILLPPIAVWSYMLDGLFIAATRAREMRNAMLLAALLALPLGWLTSGWGNHGLWLTFIAFMLLRGLCLGREAWRLEHQGWIRPREPQSPIATPAG